MVTRLVKIDKYNKPHPLEPQKYYRLIQSIVMPPINRKKGYVFSVIFFSELEIRLVEQREIPMV